MWAAREEMLRLEEKEITAAVLRNGTRYAIHLVREISLKRISKYGDKETREMRSRYKKRLNTPSTLDQNCFLFQRAFAQYANKIPKQGKTPERRFEGQRDGAER